MSKHKRILTIASLSMTLALLSGTGASAQQQPDYTQPLSDDRFEEEFKDYRTVYEDSSLYILPTTHETRKENLAPYQVVTNTFGKTGLPSPQPATTLSAAITPGPDRSGRPARPTSA